MIMMSLFFAVLAGIMNGSYVFPLKYIKSPNNVLWLFFSVLTMLIAPWVAIYLMNSDVLKIISSVAKTDTIILCVGGLFFGIGMILLSYALRFVGIAVTFLLNISVSTIIGTLLPILLISPGKLKTLIGMVLIVGLLFFLFGVISTTMAAAKRAEFRGEKNEAKQKNITGILVAILSGLFTSAQGFVYSYTLPSIAIIPALKSQLVLASCVPWVFVFNAAFIPYFLFFLGGCISAKDFTHLRISHLKDIFYVFIMAVFYYGSIVLFSKSSTMLGYMGSVIAWPIFMVIIVLTSNFWGLIQNEWKDAGKSAIQYEILSIAFLIIATIILGFDGYLNLK